MKKTVVLIPALFIAIMQFYPVNASSQRRLKYIPEHGYWVLVSNKSLPNVTTVQFYNEGKQLVGEERVAEVKFKLTKTKTLRWLKERLDKALVAFNQTAWTSK